VLLLVLELHHLGHEAGHALHVGGELRLGRDCGSGEGGDGHLLHAPLRRRLEHTGQLPNERVEEGPDAVRLEPLAEHLEDVAARGLHGDVAVVEQCEDDGEYLGRVRKDLRLAVLADLAEGEARALPDA